MKIATMWKQFTLIRLLFMVQKMGAFELLMMFFLVYFFFSVFPQRSLSERRSKDLH